MTTVATQISKNIGNAQKLADVWGGIFNNVKTAPFNAKGDGVKDDTAAIQSAINAIPTGEFGIVYCPPGKYKSGPLTIPKFVTLLGASLGSWGTNFISAIHYPLTPGIDMPKNQTLFLITDTVNPFITVGIGSAVIGCSFYYPNQVGPTATSPTVYPATIKGLFPSVDVTIKNCMFHNSYVCIDLDGADRHHIEWIYGDPLYRGIIINKCHDASRIQNIHFHDFAYGATTNLGTWKLANSVGILMLRSDAQFISDVFIWGRRVGIFLDKDATEGGSFGLGNNLSFDFCTLGIVAAATQSQAGWEFNNCHFSGPGFVIQSTDIVKININNARFWGNGNMPALNWSNTNSFSYVKLNNCQMAFGYTTPPVITQGNSRGMLYLSNVIFEDNSPAIAAVQIVGTMDEFQYLGGRVGNNTITVDSGVVKRMVANVIGYNPKGLLTAPTWPASGTPVANPFPHRVMVFVPPITGIAKNGSSIAGMATGTVILDPGETITVTYSSVQSWTWFGL